MKTTEKTCIGRREIVHLPEFGLHGIEAKIDTGAYTSSVHVLEVELLHAPEGHEVLRVKFTSTQEAIEFTDFRQKKVTSSNGKSTFRYFVKGSIEFANGQVYKVEFSLSNRSNLKYPVLLGRKLLNRGFIVDTKHVHLLGK